MATTKSSRKLYRRRVKNSKCRGKRGRTCRSKRNGRVTRHSKRLASRRA